MVDISRRKFNFDNDYGRLSAWWKAHRAHVPSPEYLSETGLIIDIDKNPVAAGFLYKTDSAFCYFAFCTVNPEASRPERSQALEYLIHSAQEWAKKGGYKAIICNSEHKKFTNRLLDKNFEIPVKNVEHLVSFIKD